MKHQKKQSPVVRFLVDAWAAMKEHREWKRSINNLKTLEWSTDYVIYLLQTVKDKDIQISLQNITGVTMTIHKIPTNYVPPHPYVAPDTVKAFQEYIGLSEV